MDLPAGVALIAAHAAISQLEPVKNAAFKKYGPEVWCGLYAYAVRVEHFPFCRPPGQH
jgi:hypothetical protein